MPTQLSYPLDAHSKSVIERTMREFLGDMILDVMWDDYFYWMTMFDSIEGWNGSGGPYNWNLSNNPATDLGIQYSNKGVSYISSGIVQISAGPTAGAGTMIDKSPLNQAILSFDQRQRFKTQVKVVTTRLITTYIRIGEITSPPGTTAEKHFGFKIDATTLYGTCGDGTASDASVTLGTIAAGNNLLLEARLIPNDKIVFYSSTTGIDGLKEVGTLTSPLPTGNFTDSIFSTWILIESLGKTGITDKGSWATATVYAVNDVVFVPGVNAYFICKNAHTSGASTEPPIGGSWQNEWEYYGVHISMFEYIQKKPKRASRKLS